MQSLSFFFFMLGVIFITVAYMNNKVEKISENKKIEYRLVPRTIYDEQIENINVSIGEYSCFVLEPKDKLSKGSIRIWLDRVSKIPVQIEMKNKIGTLKMMLKKISP